MLPGLKKLNTSPYLSWIEGPPPKRNAARSNRAGDARKQRKIKLFDGTLFFFCTNPIRDSQPIFLFIHIINIPHKSNEHTVDIANMFAKNRRYCKQKRPFCKHFIFHPVSDCKHGRWPLAVFRACSWCLICIFFDFI